MADTKNIEELLKENEYLRGEVESFWNGLREKQKFHLEIAQKITKTDSKAIANIILNMYFGKMPSDSCNFCEIFSLREKGHCKDELRCTDCIDDFLRVHYMENIQEKIEKRIQEIKANENYPHNFMGQMVDDFEWVLKLFNAEGSKE